MQLVEEKHFNLIADRYHESAKTWETLYHQVAGFLNPRVRNKKLVDVGSGGVLVFDPNLPSEVISTDISQNMLDKITHPKIKKIVGDARQMAEIPDAWADFIIFNFSLHHINGRSVKASLQTLKQIMSSSSRKLVKGGQLVIVEPVLPAWLYMLQCFFFPLTKWFIGLFNVSMIFQFSTRVLTEAMIEALGGAEHEIEVKRLEIKEKFDPLGGSFPGLIVIPAWLYPAKFRLFVMKKTI